MGLCPPEKKPHMDGGGGESEGRKWVIAGIPLRGPLKPIFTNLAEKSPPENDDGELPTTPTAPESRIPAVGLRCPAAPRKRKPSSRCNYGGVREFFSAPPDLETVFIRRVERA